MFSFKGLESSPVAWTSLKVPKCEIFDCSDFDDFYTIKSLCRATLGLK
jgi:hypothetical protein